jgi:hypothetical protein
MITARLVIYVELTDETDFDWIRAKVVPAVENIVEEEGERLDGEATVSWEMESD